MKKLAYVIAILAVGLVALRVLGRPDTVGAPEEIHFPTGGSAARAAPTARDDPRVPVAAEQAEPAAERSKAGTTAQASSAVELLVLGPDGDPLANTAVFLTENDRIVQERAAELLRNGTSVWDMFAEFAQRGTSAADGRVSLPWDGSDGGVFARKDALWGLVRLEGRPVEEPVRIPMRPGATVRVLDAQDKPLADVQVRIENVSDGRANELYLDRTNARGLLHVQPSGLMDPDAPLVMEATLEGLSVAPPRARLRDGEESVLRHPPSGSVVVRVVGPSGRPVWIPSIDVVLRGAGRELRRSPHAGKDPQERGVRFESIGLGVALEATLTAPRTAGRQVLPEDILSDPPVATDSGLTRSGEERVLELRLRSRPSLVGRVLDPDGNGVAQTVVRVGDYVIGTDNDGRFEVQPHIGSAGAQVLLLGEEWTQREDVVLQAQGETLVHVVRGGAVEGGFLQGEGLDWTERQEELTVRLHLADDDENQQSYFARLDPSGGFRRGGLPAGRYVCIVRDAGSLLHRIPEVIVALGETTRDPRLQALDPEPEWMESVVLVVGPDGGPLPVAVVEVWAGEDICSSTAVHDGQEGRVRWPSWARPRLQVWAQGHRTTERFDPGARETVELTRGLEVLLQAERELSLENATHRASLQLVRQDTTTPNAFSVFLPEAVGSGTPTRVLLPGVGRYALHAHIQRKQVSNETMALSMAATPLPVRILEVREDDAGRTLALDLPQSVF